MPQRTTEETIDLVFEQFRRGDEKAFEHYYNYYFKGVQGFCAQFLYDEAQASNTTQEAFIHLWLHRTKIEKPAGIKSFLYTAARSKCLNLIKHQKVVQRYKDHRLNRLEHELNREVLEAMDFDPVVLKELEVLFEQFVLDLPEKTREIFSMKRAGAMQNQEIAEHLGISVKTVESHYTKAVKLLRYRMKPYLPEVLLILLLDLF